MRLSRFWCRDQYQWFFNRIFRYRSDVLIWDFDCWTQTCSCWEKSVWRTRFTENDSNFQNLRTIGIVTQCSKPLIFQTSTLLQVEFFWLKPKWKNWALFSWRKVSCNVEEVEYKLRFSVFPQSGDHRRTCSNRSVFEVTSHFLNPEKLG